jgi:hypothetical protein
MKLYKLTDADGYTRRGEKNETLWGENVQHMASGTGGLCTSGVIHAYEHPLIAAFMNPVHADIANPILWICEGEPVDYQGQLKCGCKLLTTLTKVAMPVITSDQRARIAIYCALSRRQDSSFTTWANAWLDGSDRSEAARAAASMAACAAAEAAYAAAADAAYAAYAADAAYAAYAAASMAAAYAAASAACAAASAACAAASAAEFNLLEILLAVVEGGK